MKLRHPSYVPVIDSIKNVNMKKVLILGVNGFIGHHLSKRILETTDWHVYGMDMMTDRINDLLDNDAYKSRMHFFEGDITINKEWVEYHVKKCDVIQSTGSRFVVGEDVDFGVNFGR